MSTTAEQTAAFQAAAFWTSNFGIDYAARNQGRVASNTALFARFLASTRDVHSVMEYGCGTGQNLEAIHALLPACALSGMELNAEAAAKCQVATIYLQNMLEQHPGTSIYADLAMTKGLLIHIPPEKLETAYRILYNTAQKYVLIAEYYNPTPVEVNYRGHEGKLWKRDFAGEMLQTFERLRLIDYGFQYHRDPNFPQDDVSWFLLSKGNP